MSHTRNMLAVLALAVGIGAGISPSSAQAQSPADLTFTGESASDLFGSSVSGAGDVNKDGFADLIVGAHNFDTNRVFSGGAYVYSGQSGALLYRFIGKTEGDNFGSSVSGAGDVNKDGFADLIVGAWRNGAGGSSAGRAYVYSGQTGLLLYTFTGLAAGYALGFSVSGAGDVNNDGFADLIVGVPQSGVVGAAGLAYVYSGQTGALLYTFTGEASGDLFGSSVSGAGDADKDGFADLIIGARGSNAVAPAAGRAYVYSGQAGTLLYTFDGEARLDQFGVVSGAGDVNNDGFADQIVGAGGNDSGAPQAGRAYVYSGQTGARLYTFTGEAQDDRFGVSVSGAGDVDKDGFADLIIGSFGNDAGGNNAGRAYVYSGQSGGLLNTFTGEAQDDGFGFSVSGAGDVDSSGFADLLIGAPFNSAGEVRAGRAYVFLSAPTCCVTAGDANSDDKVNIADVQFVISWLFAGGASPSCCEEGSANGDGSLNIADVTYVIAWLFAGGPDPVCGAVGMGC